MNSSSVKDIPSHTSCATQRVGTLRYDVDVSWWVTPRAYEAGYYTKAYRALCYWLETEFPFWVRYFSNREIPDE